MQQLSGITAREPRMIRRVASTSSSTEISMRFQGTQQPCISRQGGAAHAHTDAPGHAARQAEAHPISIPHQTNKAHGVRRTFMATGSWRRSWSPQIFMIATSMLMSCSPNLHTFAKSADQGSGHCWQTQGCVSMRVLHKVLQMPRWKRRRMLQHGGFFVYSGKKFLWRVCEEQMSDLAAMNATT